jgi:hypothetical protein
MGQFCHALASGNVLTVPVPEWPAFQAVALINILN